MPIQVRVATVQNISKQVINVLYGPMATSEDNVSVFGFKDAGELGLAPGASMQIEDRRLDHGQIQAFQNKNLIRYITH